ncbi:MAG: transglycosylase domain-containing protein, partial [Actinomycetota bacterium]
FYEHRGFDYRRIIGALWSNIRAGRVREGGSTISQQYVKNAYLGPERTLSRKIKEAYLTIWLEQKYSKEKILLMYLDTIYLGSGAYGIEKASRLYFGIQPRELDLSQAALLAGIIRAPEVYSPLNNLELSIARRNMVLALMYEQKYIDRKQLINALSSPVELNP